MLKRLIAISLMFGISSEAFALTIVPRPLPKFPQNTACRSSIDFEGGRKMVNGGIYLEKDEVKKFGAGDVEGNILIPYKYDGVKCLSKDYFAFAQGKKWGVTDSHDKVIIPFEYDRVDFNGNYFFLRKDNKAGVKNASNTTILPFEFDAIREEYNGYFTASKVGKGFGVIDHQQNPLINYHYYNAYFIPPHFIGVEDSKGHGLFDMQGKMLFAPQYQRIEKASEKNDVLFVEVFDENKPFGKWKLITSQNISLTQPDFEGILPFEAVDTPMGKLELANVIKGYKWGMIDKKGKIRIAPNYGMKMWWSEMKIYPKLNFKNGECRITGVANPKNSHLSDDEVREKGLPCTLLPPR